MRNFSFVFLPVLFFSLLVTESAMAQNIRPIRDDVGFCWRPNEMNELMSYLDKHHKSKKEFSAENLVAGISPHDDYLYAAQIYYPLYKLIKAKEVVIFGVTHGTVRKALKDPRNILFLDDYDYWRGPYGNVSISPLREYIKDNLNEEYFQVNDKAQDIEHSIEALVPFLQYYNRKVKITPIMVTHMPFVRMDAISDKLSDIISDYMKKNKLKPGRDIFFLISSDADHYGKDFDNAPYGEDKSAHLKGTNADKQIAKAAFSGGLTKDKIEELTNNLWGKPASKDFVSPLWCGMYSIPFGLLATEKTIKKATGKNLIGKVFGYSDSKTEGVIPITDTYMGLTAPFSYKHWVGYVSAGFYLK